MRSDQFSILVLVLILGFGGLFAHPLLPGLPGFLLIGGLIGGGLVWCVVKGVSETQKNRSELAPRMLELLNMDLKDLREGRPPPWWSGPFDKATVEQKIKELEGRTQEYQARL